MQNQWILDVLADLRAFAQLNGLERLAEQLDDTSLVATAELMSQAETSAAHERGTTASVRVVPGPEGDRY